MLIYSVCIYVIHRYKHCSHSKEVVDAFGVDDARREGNHFEGDPHDEGKTAESFQSDPVGGPLVVDGGVKDDDRVGSLDGRWKD